MAEISWTDPALDDLNRLAEYIALDNPAAASDLLQSIFRAVGRLELFPESGRKPPELDYLDYRELVHNPCRIFYKLVGVRVYILHVLRTEQDVKKYLIRQNSLS